LHRRTARPLTAAAILAALFALGACGGRFARAEGLLAPSPQAGAGTALAAQAGASASAPAVPAPAAPPAPAATPAPSAPAPAAKAPTKNPLPPGAQWLTDEHGHRYYLEKMKKSEVRYVRVDKDHIRTAWGITVKVTKEDKDFFYLRVDEDIPQAKGPDPRPEQLSPEQLAAVAANYKVVVPESHRVRFVDFGHGLPTAGQWRHGFDIADMDGDGHLDIVHGPPRKGRGSTPVIFLGDGKGNWKRWTAAKFPPFPYDYGDAKVADLKGDGHPGIVLGIHLSGLNALAGDGKGNFTIWNKGLDFALPSVAGAAAYSSRALAIVDWNHDGRPDILAEGEGPRLDRSGERLLSQTPGTGSDGPVLYLNQGDGTWKRKDQGTVAEQGFGDGITVGDFNGDGLPDFATASSILGYTKLVHLHRKDGGWDDVELPIRPNAFVGAVAAGDFDHHGRADLAVGYNSFEGGVWRHGIDIFYSRPDGKWERRALIAGESRNNVTGIGVGDLDGDGNLDLVAVTSGGEMWTFLGDGKGFFTREVPGLTSPFPHCWGYHVQLADLDGDGKDEIVASFAGEVGIPGAPDTCSSGGGIAAWKAVPAADRPADGAPRPGKAAGAAAPSGTAPGAASGDIRP